jgi:hypothetical protein
VARPDVDVLNGRWYGAVRNGVVARCKNDPSSWYLTDHGEAVARREARTLGLDPDGLSASELISLAAYGTTAMGDPVA